MCTLPTPAALNPWRTAFSTSGQAAGKAHLLHLQVQLNEVQLLSERHLLGIDVVEHQAEEPAQLGRQALGGFGLVVDERGNAVEGVEEKVRVELLLQYLQLALGELRRQAAGFYGAALPFGVVVEGVHHKQQHPVNGHPEINF